MVDATDKDAQREQEIQQQFDDKKSASAGK